MSRFYPGGCAVASLLAVLLLGCPFETSTPDPTSDHSLAYRMEAARGSCRISIRIQAWPAGEAKLFQAPVYYSDNPACPVPGLRAADLDVRDAAGNRLVARDSLTGLIQDGNLILLPEAAHTFAYPVDLAPADPDRFGFPAPGIAPGVDVVDGAYFFLLPVLNPGVAERWRAPARLTLDIFSPGRVLAGSDALLDLKTPYALMFFRAVFDPVRSLVRTLHNHDLTVYTTSETELDLDATADLLAKCIRQVEDSLLPLPSPRYAVGEVPVFWGLEGIQGYWFKAEAAFLPVVHVHELVHTFVGVFQGDRDDPWWKEGMTNYLGLLIPLQAGLIPEATFTEEMLSDLGAHPAVRDVPLAASAVRTRLFLPLDSAYGFQPDPDAYLSLIYGKGGQASMILDRWLLEHSHGRKSVFDLVRNLFQSRGSSFTRVQLAEEAGRLAGAPAEAFLAGLLDQPGAFPADSLLSTFRALKAMGRFEPAVGGTPATKTATRIPKKSLPDMHPRGPGGAKY